jgi:hypothetical protein
MTLFTPSLIQFQFKHTLIMLMRQKKVFFKKVFRFTLLLQCKKKLLVILNLTEIIEKKEIKTSIYFSILLL